MSDRWKLTIDELTLGRVPEPGSLGHKYPFIYPLGMYSQTALGLRCSACRGMVALYRVSEIIKRDAKSEWEAATGDWFRLPTSWGEPGHHVCNHQWPGLSRPLKRKDWLRKAGRRTVLLLSRQSLDAEEALLSQEAMGMIPTIRKRRGTILSRLTGSAKGSDVPVFWIAVDEVWAKPN